MVMWVAQAKYGGPSPSTALRVEDDGEKQATTRAKNKQLQKQIPFGNDRKKSKSAKEGQKII